MIFLTSLMCSMAVLFAGISAACNDANRVHIENGRKPDAGYSLMPNLIVMVVLWWGVGTGVQHFFGLPIALIVLLAISLNLFIWQVISARRSNREYAQFLADHERNRKLISSKADQETKP